MHNTTVLCIGFPAFNYLPACSVCVCVCVCVCAHLYSVCVTSCVCIRIYTAADNAARQQRRYMCCTYIPTVLDLTTFYLSLACCRQRALGFCVRMLSAYIMLLIQHHMLGTYDGDSYNRSVVSLLVTVFH